LGGSPGSTQALACEVEPVAVEDGVGVGRVADEGMPPVDRELAGDEGGTAAISVHQNLQEVVAGAVIERG
jgi:hypothetical protein